mgnify:CR=1 FL=1
MKDNLTKRQQSIINDLTKFNIDEKTTTEVKENFTLLNKLFTLTMPEKETIDRFNELTIKKNNKTISSKEVQERDNLKQTYLFNYTHDKEVSHVTNKDSYENIINDIDSAFQKIKTHYAAINKNVKTSQEKTNFKTSFTQEVENLQTQLNTKKREINSNAYDNKIKHFTNIDQINTKSTANRQQTDTSLYYKQEEKKASVTNTDQNRGYVDFAIKLYPFYKSGVTKENQGNLKNLITEYKNVPMVKDCTSYQAIETSISFNTDINNKDINNIINKAQGKAKDLYDGKTIDQLRKEDLFTKFETLYTKTQENDQQLSKQDAKTFLSKYIATKQKVESEVKSPDTLSKFVYGGNTSDNKQVYPENFTKEVDSTKKNLSESFNKASDQKITPEQKQPKITQVEKLEKQKNKGCGPCCIVV